MTNICVSHLFFFVTNPVWNIISIPIHVLLHQECQSTDAGNLKPELLVPPDRPGVNIKKRKQTNALCHVTSLRFVLLSAPSHTFTIQGLSVF